MGNIVRSEEDSKYLCSLVYDIKDNGFDKVKIESILDRIMPRDKDGNMLLRYRVNDKGLHTAIFIPEY